MPTLHRTHPNLYLVLLGLCIADLLVGLGFIFIPEQLTSLAAYKTVSSFAPLHIWGYLFITIGLAKLTTVTLWPRINYRWTNYMLSIGATVATIWTVALLLLWLGGQGSLSSVALWGFFAYVRYITINELPVNPATAQVEKPTELEVE